MILIIYIMTPFTMTYSLHLFQGFRIIQTRMMVLAVIHGLRPSQKLKSILEGCNVPISPISGDQHSTPTTFSPNHFSNPRAFTIVSLTS